MARLMALDVGMARIGVAISDATGFLAGDSTTLEGSGIAVGDQVRSSPLPLAEVEKVPVLQLPLFTWKVPVIVCDQTSDAVDGARNVVFALEKSTNHDI